MKGITVERYTQPTITNPRTWNVANVIPNITSPNKSERILVLKDWTFGTRQAREYDKIICLVGVDDIDTLVRCDSVTITCTSMFDLNRYLAYKVTRSNKRADGKLLTYITSGSAQSSKIGLHEELRNWKHLPLIGKGTPVGKTDRDIITYVDYVKSGIWFKMGLHNKLIYNIACKLISSFRKENMVHLAKSVLYTTFKNRSYIPDTVPLRRVDSINGKVVIKAVNSSGGKGNYYISTTDELLQFKQDLKDGVYNDILHDGSTRYRTENDYVVQTYISSPLLYRNRKCHIRPFVIVNNLFQFFVYDKMMIYTADNIYDPLDMSPSVTDSHMNTTGELYVYRGLRSSETPWNNEDTDEPIHSLLVRRQIIRICRDIARSFTRIDKFDNNEYMYHVFAPDILIDSDYNAWLLEVNTAPGMYGAKTEPYRYIYNKWEFMCGVEPIFYPIIYKSALHVTTGEYDKTVTDARQYIRFLNPSTDLELVSNLKWVYQESKLIAYIIYTGTFIKVVPQQKQNKERIVTMILEYYKTERLVTVTTEEWENKLMIDLMWTDNTNNVFTNDV